jgi:uncharacterized protein (TIGR03435 family)
MRVRVFTWICLVAALEAQPAAPRFEVASIKLSNAGTNASSGIRTGENRLDASNVTLKRCIIGAYSVGPQQVAGGPDWMDTERFEINAKADRVVNDATFMLMLRDLLADRFQLALHRETRTQTVYVLEVAKNGPKLEKADPGEASTSTVGDNTGIAMDARRVDMDSFARSLARETELPVVNKTGLQGPYNFKLHWIRDSARRSDPSMEGASLFTAVQEQLGLRLRSEKAPVEVLVIDRAERPSAN